MGPRSAWQDSGGTQGFKAMTGGNKISTSAGCFIQMGMRKVLTCGKEMGSYPTLVSYIDTSWVVAT